MPAALATSADDSLAAALLAADAAATRDAALPSSSADKRTEPSATAGCAGSIGSTGGWTLARRAEGGRVLELSCSAGDEPRRQCVSLEP